MRFSVNQSELQTALSIVTKGVSTRSTLPILSGVLIQTNTDSLVFQTTDLELSIRYSMPALIEEPGAVVVPGKIFFEIVKSLPDAAINFETSSGESDNGEISISCDSLSFSLKTLNAEDFPNFPEVDTTQQATIPFKQFSTMVKRVARMVSKDESRAVMMGVLVTLEDNCLRMVATDSYRLGITEIDLATNQDGEDPLNQGPEANFNAVISGTFLQDIATLPQLDSSLSLAFSDNQIVVSYGQTTFINRRIEGNFPNYRQLLPDSYTTRIKVNTADLITAVKRASILSNRTTPVKFDISVSSQSMQLSNSSQDLGSAQEQISCTAEGEDMEIAFNYSYVLEGLAATPTDMVYLELQAPMKPGIFRAEEGENFSYLVMPVRIH